MNSSRWARLRREGVRRDATETIVLGLYMLEAGFDADTITDFLEESVRAGRMRPHHVKPDPHAAGITAHLEEQNRRYAEHYFPERAA